MAVEKHLSRHVIVDNKDWGLCIVTIKDGRVTDIKPFETEEEATSYTDMAIIINNGNPQFSDSK